MSIESLKEDLEQVLSSLNGSNLKSASSIEIILETNQNSSKIVSYKIKQKDLKIAEKSKDVVC